MKRRLLLSLTFTLTIVIPAIAQTSQNSIYGILVDNTGSLRTEIDNEIVLAKEIVKQTSKSSSYSIFKFATDPRPTSKNANIIAEIECSSDRNIVIKEIESIYTLGGQTTLSDAIRIAAEKLNSARPPACSEFSNRILILITDGEDRTSTTKFDELIAILKRTGIKVYAVGLVNNFWNEKGKIDRTLRDASKRYLERVTKETDGNVVFPENEDTPSEVINQLFTKGTNPILKE